VEAMIQRTVERMYSETEENRFLEVTYANGDKEVLYFKDFNSGAMIENIVDRAKKMAIKEFLETGQKGLRIAHLPDRLCWTNSARTRTCRTPPTPTTGRGSPARRARRIVYIRTLVSGKHGNRGGRSIDIALAPGWPGTEMPTRSRPHHPAKLIPASLTGVPVRHLHTGRPRAGCGAHGAAGRVTGTGPGRVCARAGGCMPRTPGPRHGGAGWGG